MMAIDYPDDGSLHIDLDKMHPGLIYEVTLFDGSRLHVQRSPTGSLEVLNIDGTLLLHLEGGCLDVGRDWPRPEDGG